MKNVRIWVLEKRGLKTYSILGLLVIIVIRNFVLEPEVRRTADYYTPILLLLVLILIFHSMFYRAHLDEDVFEKVILKRRFDDPKKSLPNFLGCAILYLVGHRLFFIYGDVGIFLMTALISLTAFMQAKEYVTHLVRGDSISKMVGTLKLEWLFIVVIGIVYFAPIKSIYQYRYGQMEIGSYFEKESYDLKKTVNIRRVEGGNDYNLPATVEVRASEERDDLMTSVFCSVLSVFSSNVLDRNYQVREVYFPNGGSLYFDSPNNITPDGSEVVDIDQRGEEWEISMTISGN